MLTSHLKGQKTVGRARASLILANNFLPLNEALYLPRILDERK
jgi:hypothetical protein